MNKPKAKRSLTVDEISGQIGYLCGRLPSDFKNKDRDAAHICLGEFIAHNVTLPTDVFGVTRSGFNFEWEGNNRYILFLVESNSWVVSELPSEEQHHGIGIEDLCDWLYEISIGDLP